MALQLPRTNAKRIEGKATQDLTAHPWAGLKVQMTLVARDQAGQSGQSLPYEFVLPERKFTKPLAKAVVEQRKKLVRDPTSPDGVADALDALTLGGDKVIEDSTIYLGLRNAYWRLRSDQSRAGIASVVDQLWEVALRIEEGDLPEAERAVKQAQDALMQALQENSSPEEIQQLVDELRQALSKYLQALASQQQDKGNMPPQQSEQNGDQLVSQQDLDKMLNNIQKLAQSGSKEMAEKMLSELKDILDRLQTGNFAENAQQQRAGTMMKDLSDIVSNQQKLLDDTFEAKRQQSAGGNQQGDEFEVSPPGQPMEFGPGMSMAPLFESLPGEAQQGSMKGQGESGSQGAPPNSPARDGPAAARRPASRPAWAARRPPERIARPAAKPDRPLRHRGRRAARRAQGRAGGDGRRQGGDRRGQSRPRHPAAEPGARQAAQGRAVDGRADDGGRRVASRARPRQ